MLYIRKYPYFYASPPLPYVTLTCDTDNKERCFNLLYFWLILFMHQDTRFKTTHIIYASNHAGIGGRYDVHFPGWDTNFCRGCCVSVEMCLEPGLNLRSSVQVDNHHTRIEASLKIYKPQRTVVDSPW